MVLNVSVGQTKSRNKILASGHFSVLGSTSRCRCISVNNCCCYCITDFHEDTPSHVII